MNAGLLIIILLLGLAFLGFPIYIALGIGTLAALNMAGMPALVLPQKLFAGMNSSSLLAIPFFILAGNIMSRSITVKLIDIANAIIGWIRGSVAVVTVLASALFGAISGSGVATASAIGGITIPAMQREGYPSEFSTAIASISSILGPIIPPSITLIVYASITNVSVSQLFMGSVIPGILLAGSLIVYALVYGKRNNLPAHEKQTPKQIGHAFKEGIWALLMPIIILGGIMSGFFSPTEAAAVATAYALVVGIFVYHELDWKTIWEAFVNAAKSTGQILIIVALASLFSWVITVNQVPQTISAFLQTNIHSKIIMLLIINIVLLIAGTFIDTTSAIVIFAPLFIPICQTLGINLVHFGMIMAVNLAIGMCTPPLGVCLFVSSSIAKISLKDQMRDLLPMLSVLIIVLLMVTYIPGLTLWLPSLLK